MLTGMLTCGVCGSNFVMRQQRSHGNKRYRCGRRNRYGKDACDNSVSILDQDVDEWVRSILEDLVTEDQLKAGAELAREKQRKRNADTAVKEIRRKLANTRAHRQPSLARQVGDVSPIVQNVAPDAEEHVRLHRFQKADCNHRAHRIHRLPGR